MLLNIKTMKDLLTSYYGLTKQEKTVNLIIQFTNKTIKLQNITKYIK